MCIRDSNELLAWVEACLGARARSTEVVQTLWSGFGHILRVQLRGDGPRSVVVKHVAPPAEMQHPRGWSGRASHERKLRSYEVERAFYAGARAEAGLDPGEQLVVVRGGGHAA